MIVFSSTLDSVVESVDVAEESARRCAHDAGFGDSDQFFIGLAIREILINAMKHGNRFDPGKKVGFEVSVDPDATGACDLKDELLGDMTADGVRRSALLHLKNMGVSVVESTLPMVKFADV